METVQVTAQVPVRVDGIDAAWPSHVDPLQDGISSVELIRVSGSDVDVVNAARVSFGKVVTKIEPKDDKLIRYLLRHLHTSPFEHNQLSFRIKTPLFVARQWMRHRMNSYNEISYRYVKSKLEFYIPADWRYQDQNNRQASFGKFQDEVLLGKYRALLDQAAQAYNDLLEAGVCREQARGLLPLCTYTEFIFTCNLHSFMHFVKLRTAAGAQWEIQVYAQAMLELAKPYFPVSLDEWHQICSEQK
jgi:thymidylate synthase (FAD)